MAASVAPSPSPSPSSSPPPSSSVNVNVGHVNNVSVAHASSVGAHVTAHSGWQRANETVAKHRTKKKTPASQLADVVAQASSWAERMNENQTFQSAFRSRGTGSGAEVGHNNNQVKAVPSFRNDLASLDSHVEFKATQFVRTLVYEMAPPAINTLTVLLFETIIFKHTFHQAWRCVLARFLLPVPFCGPVLRLIGDSSWELNIANFCFYILENGIWVSLFMQRLSYLLDQGWNYSGRYGEFVAPD